MRRRTQLVIGLAVVATGLGAVVLSAMGGDATAVYVDDVLLHPHSYRTGTYTLLGVPQAATLTVRGTDGREVLEPNPLYANSTRHVDMWADGGNLRESVHVLMVDGPGADGVSRWSYTNTTRAPGGEVLSTQSQTWQVRGQQEVFQIRGFGNGSDTGVLWGIRQGASGDPLMPKPSQFQGRLLSATPGGVALLDGARVYSVEKYTAGCSSKFLPPEDQARGVIGDAR